MKNFLLVVLATACLGLGALAWWQRQQLAALDEALQQTARDQTALKRQVAEADQRAIDAEKKRASAEAELTELRKQPEPAPASRAADAARSRANAMSALDNPAMQKFMASSIKSSLDQRYGGLFRQLRLSPAELEQFKDLLAERQMSSLDAVRALQTQGASPADLPALMKKVQGEVDESVHTLLGDQRYEQYQNFNQNIASYTLLDQIDRRLSYTNAPLQPSQSDALLRVLIEHNQPAANSAQGMALNLAQSMSGLSPAISTLMQRPLTDETIAAAQTVLSPPQLEALRQLQSEQRSQASTMQSLRGAGGAASSSGLINLTPAPAPAPTR
ncbi:MAG TPA: hypothetical protein VHD62_14445 [Opitutaceae bacterium]|nr:hypothetical protein [Opitutaceae bacterium]